MISPLDADDFKTLSHLRSQGYDLLIVSPDPVEFVTERMNPPAAATRLARLERYLLLRRLQRIGVRVVNWNVKQTLDATLFTALARQPAGRTLLEQSR